MKEKLKTERIEERLTIFDNKISEGKNFNLRNESNLGSAILSLIGSAFYQHQNIEENEINDSLQRITEKLFKLFGNLNPSSERCATNDNDAIRNQNNKLNELQTKVDSLQSKVVDFASTDHDIEQDVLLSDNTSTSKEEFDQVQTLVQDLHEKVNELYESKKKLQHNGRDSDSSQGLIIQNETYTNIAPPRYCHDYYIRGERRDGVFRIYPGWNQNNSVRVWCEFDVGEEVGWTIILARMPTENPVNFSLGWDDYKNGFGDADGEYWIGLAPLHEISVSQCSQVLHVYLQSWDQQSRHAQYKDFSISDEESGYKLSIGGYSGDAVDGMAYHNGRKFTTKDKDNDAHSSNCAALAADLGGFWYDNCYHTNPIAVLRKKDVGEGMRWNKWLSGVNLKKITFKIAPRLSQFV